MVTEFQPRKTAAIVPFRQSGSLSLERMGEVFAASGFFADSRDAAQAIVKILAGAEIGIGPVAAMTGVYVVKGRVTLGANVIAGLIKRSGRYNYRVKELTPERCVIVFFEDGKPAGESSFTIQEASAAGLAGGDNWRKFPRNMLFSRAISNGAKWYCPDLFAGPVYTPDELGAVIDGETGDPLAVDLDSGEVLNPSPPLSRAVKPPAERPASNGESVRDRVFAGWVKTGEAGIWTGFADADTFWAWMNGATSADIKARANLWARAIKQAERSGWAESWKLLAQAGVTDVEALPADTSEADMRARAAEAGEYARSILHDDEPEPEPEPDEPPAEPEPVAAGSGPAATPAQVAAIYARGRETRMLTTAQVDEECREMYGTEPAMLTKRLASGFLDHLRSAQAVG